MCRMPDPSAAHPTTMRLVTIPLSHYCDRARWALDYAGIPFSEEQHLQMVHRRPVRRAGGGTTVPVLVTGDETLSDSSDIVAYADRHAGDERRLYPDDPEQRQRIAELERGFADELGVETRRLAYYYFLAMKRVFLAYNGADAPRWQRALLRGTFPLAKRLAARKVKITKHTLAGAHEVVTRYFDAVAERLDDEGGYLVGARFSAADLTFAAMAAPVLLPPQYGVPMPGLDELSPEYRAFVDALRAHRAGRHGLRMYAEHRPRPC